MINQKSQKKMVLDHLMTYGTISSWEAIATYRITRLSEYIRSLRHDDGFNIKDEWMEKEGKRWKEYRLEQTKIEANGQDNFT